MLLRFGVGLFSTLPERPIVVIVMLIAFMLLQRWAFRAPTIGALAAGLVMAAVTGDLRLEGMTPQLAMPVWLWPQFTPHALLSLGLPLFVLAIASQNAPGIAVLQSAGYDPPLDGPIIVTGVASVLTAPFAGHGLNLAALMGAICASPDVHPDLNRRYGAGVAAAIWFGVFGSFGATAAAVCAGLPAALVAAVAGLAMTPALLWSVTGAMAEPAERQAALFALVLTAADSTILGIGTPFWGLVMAY